MKNFILLLKIVHAMVTSISDYLFIIERKCVALCKRLKKTKMVPLYSWQNYFMQWWTHHHIMSCSFSAFVVSNDNSFHIYLHKSNFPENSCKPYQRFKHCSVLAFTLLVVLFSRVWEERKGQLVGQPGRSSAGRSLPRGSLGLSCS